MAGNEYSDTMKEKFKDYFLKKGYLEAFFGMNSERVFNYKELHSIAEKVECHNTGWPIGVTLTKSDLAPYDISSGIEAVIPSGFRDMFDYWSLKKNGNFYFIRTFEEDEKPTTTKKGKNVLWVSTRIWRISELLLYCLNLGRELELDSTRKIEIFISHNGLENRILSCSDPRRFWIDEDWRLCRGDKHDYGISESLDFIKVNYKDLVYNISSELFHFFGRYDLPRNICDSIVDEFLKSRV